MSINLNISIEAERLLRETWGQNLDRAALEALVIEGYRSRRFGTAQVRRLLNLGTRWEAERWLGERGVCLNYNAEDLEEDRRTLERVLGKSA